MIEAKVYKEVTPRSFKAVLVDGVNTTVEEAIDWADELDPTPRNINDYCPDTDNSIELTKSGRIVEVPFYLVYISTGYITAYSKEYFEQNFELKYE